jgi:hypothetical protein
VLFFEIDASQFALLYVGLIAAVALVSDLPGTRLHAIEVYHKTTAYATTAPYTDIVAITFVRG